LELDDAGNASYMILYSVDGIYHSCYQMAFEYVFAVEEYITVLLNIEMLLYNFMHGAGRMYDLLEETYYRIEDWENQLDTLVFWERVGAIIGELFHNSFRYPDNYDEITDLDKFEEE